MKAKRPKKTTGRIGEEIAATWLIRNGFTPRLRNQPGIPFDILCEGRRLEVKASLPRGNGYWGFNIHRHGKLDESKCDGYILVFFGLADGLAKAFVVASPVGRKVLTVHRAHVNAEQWKSREISRELILQLPAGYSGEFESRFNKPKRELTPKKPKEPIVRRCFYAKRDDEQLLAALRQSFGENNFAVLVRQGLLALAREKGL
jgi:hypothetical protein